jgi:hypothetical protein
VPYRTEIEPARGRTALAMRSERFSNRMLGRVLAGVRLGRHRRSDAEIDPYLVRRIRKGQLGFGF